MRWLKKSRSQCVKDHTTHLVEEMFTKEDGSGSLALFFATSSLIMQKDFFPVHLGHLGLRIFLWRLFFPLNLYFTLYLLALQLVLIVGALGYGRFLKSANLQYNTLVRWADEINDSWTKRLMFFHKTLHNSLQKPFQFIFFIFFIKLQKWK